MPRKKKVDTADNTIEEIKKSDNITEKNDNIKSKKVKSVTKTVTSKKSNPKIENNDITDKEVVKKTTSKKADKTKSKSTTKEATKKTTTKSATKAASKRVTTKTSTKEATKKATTKSATKTTAKRTTSKISKGSTSSTTRTRKKTTKVKDLPVVDVVEYYDLPYRYNQTVIKLLYQTPDILFIYWDISDEDRTNFVNTYGPDFFDNTKPVLIIHNNTMNYSFEVEINDFANSWYLHINDTNCEYSVELGRRPKYNQNQYNIDNNYIFVTYSNEIESPNDHILFDKDLTTVYFKDVKTNITTKQDITSLSFIRNIGKIYSMSNINIDLEAENLEQLLYLNLKNPSSGNPTSTFR